MPFYNWQTMPFLPTARSAVGLGITLSYFYSFTRDKLAILTFGHFDGLDGLDATRHYLAQLDATRRYLTLLDAS
jgi:hypothetical protein